MLTVEVLSYFAAKTEWSYLQLFCHNTLVLQIVRQTDDILWQKWNFAMKLQSSAKNDVWFWSTTRLIPWNGSVNVNVAWSLESPHSITRQPLMGTIFTGSDLNWNTSPTPIDNPLPQCLRYTCKKATWCSVETVMEIFHNEAVSDGTHFVFRVGVQHITQGSYTVGYNNF